MSFMDRPAIDGKHPASVALRNRLKVAAREGSERPVFLAGEPGSGRRHAARVVNENAGGGAFLAVTACAPEAAQQIAAVLDRRLDVQTLYIDHVYDMSDDVRDSLRAGLRRGLPPGLRLVSSHPQPVDGLLPETAGTSDLRYRLQSIIVPIPPLRDRVEDVSLIAEAMLQRMAAAHGCCFRSIHSQASDILRSHSWPGNLRELENLLRSVVLMHAGDVVLPEMLAPILRSADPKPGQGGADIDDLLHRPLDEIERWVIERVIRRVDGSIPRAARALGISPSTIYRKIEAWDRRRQRVPGDRPTAPGTDEARDSGESAERPPDHS
jgi:DNA-binding NtrC family response regulator